MEFILILIQGIVVVLSIVILAFFVVFPTLYIISSMLEPFMDWFAIKILAPYYKWLYKMFKSK